MGMSSKEYDCITYFDLELKIDGFRDKQLQEDEMSRVIAFSSYIAPHLDPTKLKGLTMKSFMTLRGEEDTEGNNLTFEDKKEEFKDILKYING